MDRLILGLFAVLFALTAQAAGASSESLSSALAQSEQEQSQTYAKIREALDESEDSGSHMRVVYKSTPQDPDFQIQLVQQKPRKRIFLVKNYKK
jgi:hypothetical protein